MVYLNLIPLGVLILLISLLIKWSRVLIVFHDVGRIYRLN